MKYRKLRNGIACGILAVVMAFTPVTRAVAATVDQLKQELNQLKDEKASVEADIQSLRKKLKQNANEVSQITAQKDLIDQEIFLLHEQQENINRQIDTYGALIAEKQDEVDAAQQQMDAVEEKNRTRIRAMEKQSTVSYWSVVFQATTLIDMLDRLKTIQTIYEADKACLEEVQAASRQVMQAKESLDAEMIASVCPASSSILRAFLDK